MVLARTLPLVTLIAALGAVPAPAGAAQDLVAFDSCEELVSYARTHAVRAVRTGWAPSPDARPMPMPVATEDAKGGMDSTSSAGAAQGFSTTNIQEQGVDEPDLVKTNGTTMFAVANGRLHAIDVTGETPVLLDEVVLDEGHGHELLLHGDTVLVLQHAWLQPEGDSHGRAVTRLTEIDVSNPSAMRAIRHERADGEYVSARLTGDTARVVLASRAPVMHDVQTATARSERALLGKRLRQVRRAGSAEWRPRSFFRAAGRPGQSRLRVLTKCGQVRHAERFSGLDTMTVLTIDLARGLPSVDADAVMTDAQFVYGSPERLYVATQRWLPPETLQREEPPAITTRIHQFDATRPDRTTYAGSGQVAGYLLNQFAMSEHDGVLRVASTEEPQWWPRGGEPGEGSAVSTFDVATMTRRGRVGGLGKGERIYAVRFLGDRGYVVTFRQVDPLYVLDLADADAPRVTGELKIPGYSAYLHPLEDDLLLGIGQDATQDGRATGTQLSLFDVSDPADPRRVAQRSLGGYASSAAEYDHHAFLYWPQTRLAVLPVSVYEPDPEGSPPFVGAIGFRIEPGAITEVGRLEHPAEGSFAYDVQRSAVVRDRLLTLSSAGLMSSPLDAPAPGPFLEFPSRPETYGCGDVVMEDAAASCVMP